MTLKVIRTATPTTGPEVKDVFSLVSKDGACFSIFSDLGSPYPVPQG